MTFFAGEYDESNSEDINKLFLHLNNVEGEKVENFTGQINVVNGTATSGGFTLINSRSLAEDVTYSVGSSEDPFTGTLKIEDGALVKQSIIVEGKSLVHSANLTAIAWLFW